MVTLFNTIGNNIKCTENNSMQILLHHEYTNVYMEYYLQVEQHMSWEEFTSLFESENNEYYNCKQCARTWESLSRVSDYNGETVLFRDSLSVYPEFAQSAINAFKVSFRNSAYTDFVYYAPPDNNVHDRPNFGKMRKDNHIHLYFDSHLKENISSEEIETNLKYIRTLLPVIEALENTDNVVIPPAAITCRYVSSSNAMKMEDNSVYLDFCEEIKLDLSVKDLKLRRARIISTIHNHNHGDLDKFLMYIRKIFKLQRLTNNNTRHVLFRDFITRTDMNIKDIKKYDTSNNFQERIVSIIFRIATDIDSDDFKKLSCDIMGVNISDISYAYGQALRAFYNGEKITLGNNQRHLQMLYYVLSNVSLDYDTLTGDERFVLEQISNIIEVLYRKPRDCIELTRKKVEQLAGFLSTKPSLHSIIEEFSKKNKFRDTDTDETN